MRKLMGKLLPKEVNKLRFLTEVTLLTAFFLVLGFAMFYVVESTEIGYYREKIETSELSVVNLQKQYLNTSLESVKDDLAYIKDMKLVKDLINASEEEAYSTFKGQLSEELSKLIQVNAAYAQLRYINNEGMEVIRINQAKDQAVIVPEEELQDKSDRYYFKDAMALNEFEVYQSVLDLNIENGKIEEPNRPMIRFGLKLYDEASHELGIVLINYDATVLLDTFDRISFNSEGLSYLINTEGYILTGHESNNFAFMFGNDISKGYKGEYEREWQAITQAPLGETTLQFYDVDHFHTVAEVSLREVVNQDAHWYIVSQISKKDSQFASDRSIISLVILRYMNYWYLVIPVFIACWGLLLAMLYRRIHLDAIKEMAEIDLLTGTFNRNAGIEVMQSGLKYAVNNDMDYALCFVDLNDLKKVNDNFGHDTGDAYLMAAVSIIKSCFRDSDHLIRMGGDEFLIGLHGSSEIVEKNWEKVVAACEAFNNDGSVLFKVSLSHGVASVQEEKVYDVEKLIVIADQRMYIEKRKMKSHNL